MNINDLSLRLRELTELFQWLTEEESRSVTGNASELK